MVKIDEQTRRKRLWDAHHDKDFTLEINDRIRSLAKGGGFSSSDALCLFSLARNIPNLGIYLEIGSWLGGSLTCAFLGTKATGKTVNFIAIEPAVSQRFLKNVREIPNLKIIKAKSDVAHFEIQANSIDLLFIDGNHRYNQAKRDLENYWPKVKAGGMLCGHDYFKTRDTNFGVKRAVDEFFGTRVNLPKSGHCYFVRR